MNRSYNTRNTYIFQRDFFIYIIWISEYGVTKFSRTRCIEILRKVSSWQINTTRIKIDWYNVFERDYINPVRTGGGTGELTPLRGLAFTQKIFYDPSLKFLIFCELLVADPPMKFFSLQKFSLHPLSTFGTPSKK